MQSFCYLIIFMSLMVAVDLQMCDHLPAHDNDFKHAIVHSHSHDTLANGKLLCLAGYV